MREGGAARAGLVVTGQRVGTLRREGIKERLAYAGGGIALADTRPRLACGLTDAVAAVRNASLKLVCRRFQWVRFPALKSAGQPGPRVPEVVRAEKP